jgi:hypothetical protein
VVRVCCRFHFVACCFFKKRPFVNFKPYLSPGRFIFFSNLVISKIRSRRPNRVRPFWFFSHSHFLTALDPPFSFCLILPASMVFLFKAFYFIVI